METLILYVEESINDTNTSDKNNVPEIKYSILGCDTDICRLCLDLAKLQPISSCEFIKEFDNFMFIEVQLGVRFPRNVCEKCINKLNEMGSFLKMCQNSLITYKRMEENCAKLRAGNSESESSDRADLKPMNISFESEEYVMEDVTSGTESVDPDIEPELEQVKIETAIPEWREETVDANIEFIEPVLCESVETENVPEEIKKRKGLKRNRNPDSKMCYTCGACVPSLARHYKTSSSCKPKNFKCPLCNLHFVTKHRMLSHQRASHWDKISAKHCICHICSKMFKHPETLERHVRIHKNGKEFMCETCGKSYARQTELRDHRNIHNQVKPYSCKYCGKSFYGKSNHFAHELKHQKENFPLRRPKPMEISPTEVFVCSMCNREFSNQTYLNHHMQSHEDERSNYECKQCEIQFDDIDSCLQHSEIHKQKLFFCPICEKRFRLSFNLRKHMLVHTGERPYLCSECGNKFRTSSHLKRHTLLIHNVTQVKPFECQFCEKTFNLKENLLVHERIHTGERPYKCHVCDKSFMEASSRKKHVRKVHGDDEVNNIYIIEK